MKIVLSFVFDPIVYSKNVKARSCIMSHPTLAYPSHVNSIGDFNFNCRDFRAKQEEIKTKRKKERREGKDRINEEEKKG